MPVANSTAALAWPLQSTAALNAFFGNPDANGDGKPDPKWEAENIIKIVPPYNMVWAFDTDADGKVDDPVAGIRVHKKAAPHLMAFLDDVLALYGSQAAIEKARMHLFGGAYNFRLKRGGTTLSTHSWGVAWDMDPERNGFKQPYVPGQSIPMQVVDLAKKQGAIAGVDWTPPDGMHFQFARIR